MAQYKIVGLSGGVSEIEKALNKLSEEGWYVSHTASTFLLLERSARCNRRTRTATQFDGEEERDGLNEVRRLCRINRDLELRVEELEYQMPRDKKELVDELTRSKQRRSQAQELIVELAEALIWCSGSADFGEGGFAKEGWEKGPRVALDKYRKWLST